MYLAEAPPARHPLVGRCAARCRTTPSRSSTARRPLPWAPKPSLKLTTDIIEFCARKRAQAGTRSPSPAITPVRVGFQRRPGAGLHNCPGHGLRRVHPGAGPAGGQLRPAACPSSSAVHNDFFEEIAKFRAARRMWARVDQGPLRRQPGPSPCGCGSTPRPWGPPSSARTPRTTSSAGRSRRWRRSWAAPSRSTSAATTRPTTFRQKRPCGCRWRRNSSSPTSPALPPPPTLWVDRCS